VACIECQDPLKAQKLSLNSARSAIMDEQRGLGATRVVLLPRHPPIQLQSSVQHGQVRPGGSAQSSSNRLIREDINVVQAKPFLSPLYPASMAGSSKTVSPEWSSRLTNPLSASLSLPLGGNNSHEPIGNNSLPPEGVPADGICIASDSCVDLLDCDGPSLELIVLELQKSVQLLMCDSEVSADSDRLWRESVESQLTQQDQLLSNVSSDQLGRQDELLTQISSWRGSVDEQLTKQADLLTVLKSEASGIDDSVVGLLSSKVEAFSAASLSQFRLDQFDLELADMITWRSSVSASNLDYKEGLHELQARLSNLEESSGALNTEEMKMETRMAQHEDLIETLQGHVSKLRDVPVDSLRLRQLAVEENTNILQGDVQKLHQLHLDSLESADGRLKNLEDKFLADADSPSHMNLTHWETIHALCDNVRVQQQQQMDMISGLQVQQQQQKDLTCGLRESDNAKEAMLALLKCESQAIDARLRGAGWHNIQGVHALLANLQAQQEKLAHSIYGLQSDLHSLQLRASEEGFASTQVPPSTQMPEPAPDRPSSLIPVIRDACSNSPTKPLATAPNEYEDSVFQRELSRFPPPPDNQSSVLVRRAASADRAKKPSDTASHDYKDVAFQRELSKFPQFALVAVEQQGLSRLPKLR